MLLPWRDNRPIVRHAAYNALQLGLGGEVIVVVRPDLPELEEALEGLAVRCVPNPSYREGMASSIAAGIASLGADAEGALLLLGDEPEVSPSIVAALLEAYRRDNRPITVPRYGAAIGPPTLFAHAAFPLLAKLTGDAGARQLIAQNPEMVSFVPFPESDRPRDVDTEGDYVKRET